MLGFAEGSCLLLSNCVVYRRLQSLSSKMEIGLISHTYSHSYVCYSPGNHLKTLEYTGLKFDFIREMTLSSYAYLFTVTVLRQGEERGKATNEAKRQRV